MVTNFEHMKKWSGIYERLMLVERELMKADSAETYLASICSMRWPLEEFIKEMTTAAGLTEEQVLQLWQKPGEDAPKVQRSHMGTYTRVCALENIGYISGESAKNLHALRRTTAEAINHLWELPQTDKQEMKKIAEDMYEKMYRETYLFVNQYMPQNAKKKTKKKALRIVGVVMGVLLVCGLGFFGVTYAGVKPQQEVFTYELGTEISQNQEDYLEGLCGAISLWETDFSALDEKKTGSYPVTSVFLNKSHSYTICIEDTIAPEMEVVGEPFYWNLEERLSADALMGTLTDEDADVATGIDWENGQKEQILFPEVGEYEVTVFAEDSSGNRTEKTVAVTVDTAPILSGIKDYYIAAGSENVDYLTDITAEDDVDGELTTDIIANGADIDLNASGVYELSYQVADSYGLQTTEEIEVHVMDADELQGLINTHEIGRHTERIIGAPNLYDSGYFAEDDIAAVLDYMNPIMTRIEFENGHGSGFIIAIREDDLIVCTNQHVAGGSGSYQVYFHDGTHAAGETLGTNKDVDIAFVKVNLSDIPEETFDTLMTAHINKTYWDGLANNEEISVGFHTINENGGIWKDDSTGKMLSKIQGPVAECKYSIVPISTRISTRQYAGCSGSAIVDGHGNLISMVWGEYRTKERESYYLSVNLQNIIDNYENIVGDELYYE